MDKFELWLRRRVCGVVLVTCEVVDDDDTRDFIFVAAWKGVRRRDGGEVL